MKEFGGSSHEGPEKPHKFAPEDPERAKYLRREIKTRLAGLDAIPQGTKPLDKIGELETMEKQIAAIQNGTFVPIQDLKMQKEPPEEKKLSLKEKVKDELNSLSWKTKAIGAGGGLGGGIIDAANGNYTGAVVRGIVGGLAAGWLGYDKWKHKNKNDDGDDTEQ